MPAQQQHTVWTFYLSATAGDVPVGMCCCLNVAGDRYIIATDANRALTDRHAAFISLQAGDPDNLSVEGQLCGVVPTSISLIGAGDQDENVCTGSDGRLVRASDERSSGEIVGRCDADGTAYLQFSGIPGPAGTSLELGLEGQVLTADEDGLPLWATLTDDAPGTDGELMYNDDGEEATTSLAKLVSGELTLTSPVIVGTPRYQGTRVKIKGIVTELQTAATTQVNCGTYTLADETTVGLDVFVTCTRRTSNTKRGRWKFSAVVSRNGAGAVLDVLDVGDAFNLNAGSITCDVDSNDFRVRVTPASTDGYNWTTEIRAQDGTAA